MTTVATPPAHSHWKQAGQGLELALELPPGPYRPEQRLPIRLHFRNASSAPLRIYLLPEPFRSGTSLASSSHPPAWFPPPRPHGYLPAERDFPLIPAGGELDTTQTIIVPSASPSVELRWTYENRITSWPGGIQTFDGPTQALFGGGPIPHIWTGKCEVSAQFPVQ